MNRPALEQAIRVLQTVDEDAFDMNQYQSDCGTVACIAGHCAMDPWFKLQGFSLRNSPLHDPLYGRHEGRRAIETFFELTRADSNLLFYAERQDIPTPQDAIVLIERLLAK